MLLTVPNTTGGLKLPTLMNFPHLMNFLCPQVPLASSMIFSATPVALHKRKREQ